MRGQGISALPSTEDQAEEDERLGSEKTPQKRRKKEKKGEGKKGTCEKIENERKQLVVGDGAR